MTLNVQGAPPYSKFFRKGNSVLSAFCTSSNLYSKVGGIQVDVARCACSTPCKSPAAGLFMTTRQPPAPSTGSTNVPAPCVIGGATTKRSSRSKPYTIIKEATMVLMQRNDCNTPLGTPEEPPVNLIATVSPRSTFERTGTAKAYRSTNPATESRPWHATVLIRAPW